jgi:hypothetical protein
MGGWNIFFTQDGKEYKKTAGHHDQLTNTTPIWVFKLGKNSLSSQLVEEYHVKTGGIMHGVYKSYNKKGEEVETHHYMDGVCVDMKYIDVKDIDVKDIEMGDTDVEIII